MGIPFCFFLNLHAFFIYASEHMESGVYIWGFYHHG